MSFQSLLIQVEHEKGAICVITDDHKFHIKQHLKYIWKPRILKHIIDHLILWQKKKKLGLNHITTEIILSNIKGLKWKIKY